MRCQRRAIALLLLGAGGCATLRVDVDVWTAGRSTTAECVSTVAQVGTEGWIHTDPTMRDVATAGEDCWRTYDGARATGWFGNTQFVFTGGAAGVTIKSISFDPRAFIAAGVRGVRTAIGVAARIQGGGLAPGQPQGAPADATAHPSKASLRSARRVQEREALANEVDLSRRVDSLVRALEQLDASVAALSTATLVPELRRLLATSLLPEDRAAAVASTAPVTSQLPPPPGNVRLARAGTDDVVLQWEDLAADESLYVVERRKGSSGPFARVAPALAPNTTAFRDAGLEAGTSYEYRVLVVNPAGSASAGVAVKTALKPPGAATITAVDPGHDVIKLTWKLPAGQAIKALRLERRKLGEERFEVIATIPKTDQTTYEDAVTPRVAYEYRVVITSEAGEATSAAAQVIAADAPARQPASVQAEAGVGLVSLTWVDLASGEAGYEVHRKPAATWKSRVLPPDSEVFRDREVAAGQEYEYTVSAFNLDHATGAQESLARVKVRVPASWWQQWSNWVFGIAGLALAALAGVGIHRLWAGRQRARRAKPHPSARHAPEATPVIELEENEEEAGG